MRGGGWLAVAAASPDKLVVFFTLRVPLPRSPALPGQRIESGQPVLESIAPQPPATIGGECRE
jgi:hypothetical protein